MQASIEAERQARLARMLEQAEEAKRQAAAKADELTAQVCLTTCTRCPCTHCTVWVWSHSVWAVERERTRGV